MSESPARALHDQHVDTQEPRDDSALRASGIGHTDRMTLLDEIIDGASDGTVTTVNLLRKVQVAALRLGAADVAAWTKRELNGYPLKDDLPDYRRERPVSVRGTFSTYGPRFITRTIPRPQADEDIWQRSFHVSMRQPLAELEGFATEGGQMDWHASVVQLYISTNTFAIEDHDLFSVHQLITPQMIRGVIDNIRNSALDFAVTLQLANPDAGSVGGPTVTTDASVASVVYNVTNNVNGNGTNIAAGENIVQSSTVASGDHDALIAALREIGLSESASTEFADALDTDRSVEGSRVRAFLERVQSGAVAVATDVAVRVTTGQLVTVALEYLGKL